MEGSVSRFVDLDFELVFLKELACSLFEQVEVDVSVCPDSLHMDPCDDPIRLRSHMRRIILFLS